MKKACLCMLIAFALLFTAMISIHATEAEAPVLTSRPWDGVTVADGFAGGTGLADDPYLITNGAELAYLSKIVKSGEPTAGKYYALGAHIDLNGKEMQPIGIFNALNASESAPFCGVFDGQGFCISRFQLHSEANAENNSTGLFGYVRGGEIRNVHLLSSKVIVAAPDDIHAYAALLVGYLDGGRVFGCSADVTSSLESTHSAGGLVGKMNDSIVEYCVNDANIRIGGTACENTMVGGVVGCADGENQILYCVNRADLSADIQCTGIATLGGVCGFFRGGEIEYCYNTGIVKAACSTYIRLTVGGVLGRFQNKTSTMVNCYHAGSVEGTGVSVNVGLLFGFVNTVTNASVSDSLAVAQEGMTLFGADNSKGGLTMGESCAVSDAAVVRNEICAIDTAISEIVIHQPEPPIVKDPDSGDEGDGQDSAMTTDLSVPEEESSLLDTEKEPDTERHTAHTETIPDLSTSEDQTTPTDERTPDGGLIYVVIVGLLVLAAGAVGIILSLKRKKKD